MAALRLRPPLWAVLALLPALTLLLGLGFWQLQRGHDKAALAAVYAAAQDDEPVRLHADTAPPGQGVRAVIARGRYLPEQQLLLDNQSRQRVPGYHVWTPFALSSGGRVLVNRGWIPVAADRRTPPLLPAPEGEIELRGLWRTLPVPGLHLAADCETAPWPRIVQYPRAEDLACHYDPPPASGLLLLDPAEDGGYVREWRIGAEVPPERHYAYAAQWFAFAGTLLVIFVLTNLKRSPDHD